MTEFIDAHQVALQIIGGIVLAAFGIYLFSKNPTRALQPNKNGTNNYWGDIGSGFLLTFSNPLILFFIIGLYARFNFIQPEYKIHHFIIAFTLIFTGALLWWYFITLLVNRLRKRFNVRSLWLINRIIGLVLIGMALAGVGMAIKKAYFPSNHTMPDVTTTGQTE